MKKNLMLKICITLLMSIAFSMFFFNHNVNAVSPENQDYELEEILNSEEKIMMYDATTGETTEVNMEELEKSVAHLKNVAISKPCNEVTRSTFSLPLRLRFCIVC